MIFPRSVYVLFILCGAVFAIATTLMGGIAAMRYPTVRVAEDGWLPAVFKKTTKSGYPWVIQLTFYLASVLPIIFDFSMDAIVSLVMGPALLMCFFLNISMIKIVKKYPDHWKKSILHMPDVLFAIICLLGATCDLVIIYNLLAGCDLSEILMIVVCMVVLAAIAIIRLRTGAVNADELEKNRQEIIAAAIRTE